MSHLEGLLGALRCPDDGSPLAVAVSFLQCQWCERQYPRPAQSVVDLMAGVQAERFSGVSDDYWKGYVGTRERSLTLNREAAGWGAPQRMDPEWVHLRRRYSERVVELVARWLEGRPALVADTSAGAGYVSFALASKGIPVIHLDLDPDSIASAATWLALEGAGVPLLAVRADYFALPLRRSVDVVISTDTLIRGREHELALLREIRRALADGGVAVVDLHNWLHNPLRRLGLLPDNFSGNWSYLRSDVTDLLRQAGFRVVQEIRYRQEEDQSGLRRVLASVVPCTRFLLVIAPEHEGA